MRPAFLLALFAAAFLATAAIVRGALGWPEASGLRAKLEHYEASADDFDVLFVGSSNVMNSILPELFDAELATRGYSVRSYNLGVPGMLAFETDYVLERILAGRPERLRWVFVELTDWRPNQRLADKTERNVNWHSLERVAALAEAARSYEPFDGGDRWAFVRDHVELALYRLANVGRVQERLALELGVGEPELWNFLIDPAREGGYVALEDARHPGAERGRASFLADLPDYQRKVAALRRQRPADGPAPAYLAGAAERRMDLFDGTGVELIHVLLAACNPTESMERLGPPAGPFPELWAFNRPSEHPELFQLPVRYDNRHLQRPGAEILTRLLAARFADHLDRGARH